MRNYLVCITWPIILGLNACGGGSSSSQEDNSDAVDTNNPNSTRLFSDVTENSGIYFIQGYQNPKSLSEVQKFCAGIAAGDINNDGYVDLFFVKGDLESHKLYLNQGGLRFTEVSTEYGLPGFNHQACGPTFADIDGDKDLDLFIGGIEGQRNYLFENRQQENGQRQFVDVTEQWGLLDISAPHTISASFGDYNRDGWPDLFLAHWGAENKHKKQHLFRNDIGEAFTNVTESSGLANLIYSQPLNNATHGDNHDYSFLATFADINNDRYQDLLMVSDFATSKVFINTGLDTFTYQPNSVIKDENGMGSAVGDYDNDGDLDWFVTGIFTPGSPGNRMYHNMTVESSSTQLFSDSTQTLDLADGGWAWAACMQDFNLDGFLDIFHVNGWSEGLFNLRFDQDASRLFISYPSQNSLQRRVFKNEAYKQGLADTQQGRAISCFDADNDGDIDIVTLNNDYDAVHVYKNNIIENTSSHFLSIQLEGKSPNTEAIGARIFLRYQDNANQQKQEIQQMREITIGSNFVSQNPTGQIFGLNTVGVVSQLRVEWADGRITEITNVSANQHLKIKHPDIS